MQVMSLCNASVQIMRESFTVAKPHIAEDFIAKLMSGAKESGDVISFSKDHLNTCLNSLASGVMERERANFDNYSMYYENLLRVKHQLLYQREQEVKQCKDKLKAMNDNMFTEVQCQLADTSQSLLLEITALRAKIAEMRQATLTQEMDIR